ncbi:collagen alpha-1(III) chain-like [Hyaena hyaena]|uniref:collagen alpha-1(III) chain-like n=1 Tax=Hyaena hyaena TaxID=95912 RepID=UPI0019208126|nr:collagen alpha-1(III) chain-like [Hyaena hyaena]
MEPGRAGINGSGQDAARTAWLRHRPGLFRRGEAALLGAPGPEQGAAERAESGGGGGAGARQVPSPPTELSNPGSGEAGGAQCNAENAGHGGGEGTPEGPPLGTAGDLRQGQPGQRRRTHSTGPEGRAPEAPAGRGKGAFVSAPGVRSRVCGRGDVCAGVRECERPGGWERALGILLASQRGEQEAGVGRAGERGALPRTRTRRARAHTHTHTHTPSLPRSLPLSPSQSRALRSGNPSRAEPNRGMRSRNGAAREVRARDASCAHRP